MAGPPVATPVGPPSVGERRLEPGSASGSTRGAQASANAGMSSAEWRCESATPQASGFLSQDDPLRVSRA